MHRNPAMRSPAYDEETKNAKKMNTREGLKSEEKIRRGGEGLWKRKRVLSGRGGRLRRRRKRRRKKRRKRRGRGNGAQRVHLQVQGHVDDGH